MDTSRHTMSTLFSQLGLDNSPEAIARFVKEHHLPEGMLLSQAPFGMKDSATLLRNR